MKQLQGLLKRPYRPRSGRVTTVAWATRAISPCASRFTGGVHYNSCLGVSNYMCVRRWVHKGRGERRARGSGGATRSSGRLARVAWSGVVSHEGDRGVSVTEGKSPQGLVLDAASHRALRGPATATIPHAFPLLRYYFDSNCDIDSHSL